MQLKLGTITERKKKKIIKVPRALINLRLANQCGAKKRRKKKTEREEPRGGVGLLWGVRQVINCSRVRCHEQSVQF